MTDSPNVIAWVTNEADVDTLHLLTKRTSPNHMARVKVTATDQYGRSETLAFNAHFGDHHFAYGSLWHDQDGDDVFDSHEQALEGWSIQASGIAAAETFTDLNGDYMLELGAIAASGTYEVAAEARSGWNQTLPSTPGVYQINTQSDPPLNSGLDFARQYHGVSAGPDRATTGQA